MIIRNVLVENHPNLRRDVDGSLSVQQELAGRQAGIHNADLSKEVM